MKPHIYLLPPPLISQHCRSQGKNNFECYYEPFSKCTIEDALRSDKGRGKGGAVTINDLPLIRSEIMSKEDRKVEVPFEEALAEIMSKAEGEGETEIETDRDREGGERETERGEREGGERETERGRQRQ
jgi:hypothetical protein